MKLLLFMLIPIFFISCSKNDTSKDEKIIKDVEKTKEYQKELKEFRERAKKRQKKIVKLETDKDEVIIIGSKRMEKIEKDMKHKDEDSIKNNLRALKLMKAKKETYKARNFILSGKTKVVNVHFYDELKNMLTVKVIGYSLRNLHFKNDLKKVYLDTIGFNYEKEKKRLVFEVVPIKDAEKIIEKMKKGIDNFVYKSYNLADFTIHASISYKYKVMNVIYLYLGYRWNLSVENDISDDFLEIIKSINYERFKELKKKYD